MSSTRAARKLYTPRLREIGARKYRFTSLVYEIWRDCAGVSLREAKRAGSYESMLLAMEYIRALDARLDSAKAPNPETHWREYKFDPRALRLLKMNLEDAKEKVPRERWLALARAANGYRRDCKRAIFELGKKRAPTFSDVFKYKETTNGGMFRVLARLANEVHSMPEPLARRIEDAFHHFSAVVHFSDDLIDLREDNREKVNNMVIALLKQNGEAGAVEEYLNKGKKIKYKTLSRLAPKTHSAISEEIEKRRSEILKLAQGNAGIKSLADYPRIIMNRASVKGQIRFE